MFLPILSLPCYFVSFWCAFLITTGKREAPAVSQEQAAKKKSKTEDNVALKSSSVASLVAYGEDDSSDEEGSTSPEDKQSPSPNRDSSDSQLAGRLPFWAVRR